ncbi:MAG: SAM-dependent methyltransferase, partial [Pseudomonadota bacterium]
MTALGALIRSRIAQTGPITVADYMGECLMHPVHGYYATRDPLGATGDFITAPEISQMFGELIGLTLAQCWQDQGAPDRIVLAELGPGRGTLMADALRATRGVPDFHASLEVHFVETSPVLRRAQADAVPDAIWHDGIETLPPGPLFLIANEFFDALPIRQFVRDGDAWRERMVGLEGDTLQIGLSSPAPLTLLEHRLADTKDSDLVEICPTLPGIISTLA